MSGCIQGSLGYATALYERETIKRHVEYLRCIARAMVDDEVQEIDRLDILPAAERHKLLVEWNDTAVEYPDNKCVHELFEAQAALQPNAIAVKQGERQMSYGELNAKANQLAHRLRKSGVKPDDAGGHSGRAQRGDGGGAAGHAQGGWGVCAAGPGLSGAAAGVHA